MGFLQSLLGGNRAARRPSTRSHLRAQAWPAAVYAVGDIHGCKDELLALRAKIIADARDIVGEKWLVYLGDFVDRGPRSADVLDLLTAPPPAGWTQIALAGNHEVMMLDFVTTVRANHDWLLHGGATTLASYGIDARELVTLPERQRRERLQACIPDEHLDFLRALPVTLSLPDVVLVHAGIRRGIAVTEQSETDLLWIRNEFFDAPADPDMLVVHGHTPASEPVVAPGRICIDTGAFGTGILTAVRLERHAAPRFISANATVTK